MRDVSTPETNEIQFQISLLSIAFPGTAERQTKELEKLLSQTEAVR